VLEFSNELRLSEDVAVDRTLNIGLRRSGSEARLGIQRVELKEIAMR
jgi:hypothetical protein